MASTAKTLTFVIPAYNMESYLDRCVNSLLSASDISDLEVLIVDDGSKDGTAGRTSTPTLSAPSISPTRATAAR